MIIRVATRRTQDHPRAIAELKGRDDREARILTMNRGDHADGFRFIVRAGMSRSPPPLEDWGDSRSACHSSPRTGNHRTGQTAAQVQRAE
jgi:hypothetical protein